MPSLINGLGGTAGFGEFSVARNDDGSSAAIDIRPIFGAAGLNFFGTNYTTLFVNNNGNITFGGSLSSYTPSPIGVGLGIPIIAPYWMDIDTRSTLGLPLVSPGGTSQGTNLVYYDLDITGHIFTATWDDVGYYSNHNTPSNAFQVQLINQGGGNFDIVFIYENIARATADLAGIARAGYSPGGGRPGGFELPGSGNVNAILQIDTNNGNTGTPGYWAFQVRGGQVQGGLGQSNEPPVVPRPIDFSVQTVGLQREGNSGLTPFDVVIRRGGGDLGLESIVKWRIIIDDPADLAPGQALSGTVVFPAFVAAITIPISIAGDRTFEDDDLMRFQLTEVSLGAEVWEPGVESAAVIVNDDPATTYAFAGDLMRGEGQDGATSFEFLVLRSGNLSEAAIVDWRLAMGTADVLDFRPTQESAGTVAFAAGQTQAVITVQVSGDIRVELDETFTVRLTAATTRTSANALDTATTATILDDDQRQTLLVASPTATVLPEGDLDGITFSFILMRVGDVSMALQLPYVIGLPTTGGVSAGEVISPLSGIVSFAAGVSQVSLDVLVRGDNLPEGNETFLVTVGGGPGINSLQLTGVVLNDDKIAAFAGPGPEVSAGLVDDDISIFVQQLAGGGLWSNAGII